ncbi:MAG TPA: slipin family protein [Acidobacteriaceae bacterium]
MQDHFGLFCILSLLALLLAIILLRVVKPKRLTILEYQRGALFLRGSFKKTLEAGRYWSTTSSQILVLDVRLQTLTIAGQEILTSDGLSLKITLAGEYRIADPGRYLLTSTAPGTSLYLDAQQALRDAAANQSFESILETRAVLNARMLESLAPKAQRLGMEVISIEIRDIILPGEIKRAYAQVLTAQKESLAALERARGETAALRSLANAARLMQEHPGLLQLRAVQAIESSKGNTLTLELSSLEKQAP